MTLLRHDDLSWQFSYVELMLVSASTPVAQHKWWWRPQWGGHDEDNSGWNPPPRVKSGVDKMARLLVFFFFLLYSLLTFVFSRTSSQTSWSLFSSIKLVFPRHCYPPPNIHLTCTVFFPRIRLGTRSPDIPLVDVDRCEWGCRQVQLWLRSRVRGLAAVCGVDACTWTRDLLSSARLHASSSRGWRDEADRACTCKCLHASSARPLTPGYPAYSPPGGAGDNVRDVRPACAASSVCPGRVPRVTALLAFWWLTTLGRAELRVGDTAWGHVWQRTCCSGHKARCCSHVTWWFSDR